MYKKEELEDFKKKLNKTRMMLQTNAEHLESDVHYTHGGDAITLNHMADAGSDTFEMDFSMEQLENKENLLYEIDEALKIENKSYGQCETCDKKIPKTRLSAIPFAKNCIQCQEKQEADLI